MNYLRTWGGRISRWVVNATWFGLGLWTSLAIFFKAPLPRGMALVAAVAVLWLFVAGFRQRPRIATAPAVPVYRRRWLMAALLVSLGYAVYYFGFIVPDPNLNWAADHALMPVVRIEGDQAYVGNVRNFTWRTATDFTPGYYDRVYDLSKLETMYYVVASMAKWEGVAHVFVCFGFSDGQHVAISVEGRRIEGRPYRVIPSMFRQYQLIYVIGDERDVVGLRGAIWQDPVFFYPARTTQERKRAIFVDMLARAHKLEHEPEFYHLITNNCMNNITYHLRRLGGRPLPHDLQVLLTGMSDRVAYRLGYIDTDLPFESARRAFRVDEWMRDTPLDESFSARLRETIEQRVADERRTLESATASPAPSPGPTGHPLPPGERMF